MITFHIPGEPVAFARSGGKGSIRFTPKRQRDFMSLVKLSAATAMDGKEVLTGPLNASIRATYLIPASWPKKKRESARWKTSTPDCDNLAKIVLDACNEIVFLDDCQIVSLTVEKSYGPISGVVVCVSRNSDNGGEAA